MSLEIVERSSGYWIVDDYGVAWDEPFIHLSEALKKLSELNLKYIEKKHLTKEPV
tara:strand:- start:243 stop:407 length:165 start_codon:yes stop_codon:yes gene_type:complete